MVRLNLQPINIQSACFKSKLIEVWKVTSEAEQKQTSAVHYILVQDPVPEQSHRSAIAAVDNQHQFCEGPVQCDLSIDLDETVQIKVT